MCEWVWRPEEHQLDIIFICCLPYLLVTHTHTHPSLLSVAVLSFSTKGNLEERFYFILQVIIHYERKPGQELEAATEV